MNRDRLRRARGEIAGLADARLDWVSLAQAIGGVLDGIVPFDRSCWHTVDPGTVLFTGSLNQNIGCSGTWLATYEYVVDDVNKWWFLARSGRIAGATSLATYGDLFRSARHRSHEAYGIGDELRVSFVIGGTYWAAASLLRDAGQHWFTEDDVGCLASLSEPIADGFRRALLVTAPGAADTDSPAHGPGVIVFDGDGNPESLSPGAEHWIGQMVEVPPPETPAESKIVQAVAASARATDPGQDPLQIGARSRVRTRSGSWLLLYGTRLAGGADDRTPVIIQPATPAAVAPLVTLAYGLSERESQVTRLCKGSRPGTWHTPSPCRRTPSRTISSRSSPRPAFGAAASWSARSSSSTTCPAGKTSRTCPPAGSRRHHRCPSAWGLVRVRLAPERSSGRMPDGHGSIGCLQRQLRVDRDL